VVEESESLASGLPSDNVGTELMEAQQVEYSSGR
jgi:hypothetical protein